MATNRRTVENSRFVDWQKLLGRCKKAELRFGCLPQLLQCALIRQRLVQVVTVSLVVCGCVISVAAGQKNQEPAPKNEATEPADEDLPTEEEEDEKLPLLSDMELPSFQRLMQGPAIDWLVLMNNKVIVIEPVSIRPGTVDDVNDRVSKSMRKPGDPADSEETKRRRQELYYIPVTLLEGQDREYKIHVRFVRQFIYYEDLMVRRIDQLLDDLMVRQAYELMLALEAREPKWKGIPERKDRLLFVESIVRSREGQDQHALALLELLHSKRAAFNGLEAQFGVVAGKLISKAVAESKYREARYFLRRIGRRYPNHQVIKDWNSKLADSAKELVARSITAERTGEIESALDLAEEAARVWPESSELLPVYNRLATRHQRLRVGVVELAEPTHSGNVVSLGTAERRIRPLTQMRLFEPSRLENKIVRFDSRFFTDWEPTELGHSVVFQLKSSRTAGDSQPFVTAAALGWGFAELLDPKANRYDARFRGIVDSVEIRSPFELLVRFRQVPLRPEAIFSFSLPAAESHSISLVDNRQNVVRERNGELSHPFYMSRSEENRSIYRRTIPDSPNTADHRISEVVEIKYPSYYELIQGMMRGEFSMLPRSPAYQVRNFGGRQDFFTQPYALPTTHVLQFNPHNKALAARTLRRALIYALNRPRILEEEFLREPQGDLGRVVSAPFATKSYAHIPDSAKRFEPHQYDPALAYSLARTAEKELNSKIPELRFICGADPEIRAAAARIVDFWKSAGVTAKLQVASSVPIDSDSDEWDVAYRSIVMTEPIVDLWPFLALTKSTETDALGHLPTWLRKQLLDLDRVGDMASATALLHKFHELFWAEVHLIPLWELDDVLVYRKHVRGVPERPISTYQKIERWKVEPWFSREAPQ